MKIDIRLDEAELRRFTEALGPRAMDFALTRATNDLAFAIRDAWKQQANRVFDRPTALTRNAALVRKAGTGSSRSAAGQNFRNSGEAYAEIYLRDEATKGTPPVRYLIAQVEGGARRQKRFERALIAAGVMPQGMFAMPGGAAKLDAFGNMTGGFIVSILSALGANPDAMSNSRTARPRRLKQRGWAGTRNGGIFAIREPRNGLRPGVYQRFRKGIFSTVEPLIIFTRQPRYTPRYTVYDTAEAVIRRDGNTILQRAVALEVERAISRAGGGRR